MFLFIYTLKLRDKKKYFIEKSHCETPENRSPFIVRGRVRWCLRYFIWPGNYKIARSVLMKWSRGVGLGTERGRGRFWASPIGRCECELSKRWLCFCVFHYCSGKHTHAHAHLLGNMLLGDDCSKARIYAIFFLFDSHTRVPNWFGFGLSGNWWEGFGAD